MSKQLTSEELNELHERTGRVPQHAKRETHELPKWAKIALARTILYDETYEEAARAHGKSKSSLSHYACSPAGRKWTAALEQIADDPVRIAEVMIRSSADGVVFDVFWAMEAAKAASDYKEVGIIARNLLDRVPELRAQVQPSGGGQVAQIVINLGAGASLEPPVVESSHVKHVEAGETQDAVIVE